jgi:hypothetical protein
MADRIDTANPKFRGAFSGQTGVATGMNVGGLTDAQVRINAWAQGSMLHKQLFKDKNASSPVPST